MVPQMFGNVEQIKMAGRTKTRRVRRTRQQWAALVAEQADSDLSFAAFCEGRGISASSFANARRRIAPMDCANPSQASGEFVAVGVDTPAPAGGAWDIELALATGVVLRIRSA